MLHPERRNVFDRLFLAHPRAVGEGYFEHQRCALSFALRLIGGGLACMVHAVVPACCESTGSRTVCELNAEMQARRGRCDDLRYASANADR
jgi:hypothetical protein